MSNHQLKPLTALAGDAPVTKQIGSVLITETDQMALASVTTRMGHEKAIHAAAKKLFKGKLPDAGKSVATGKGTTFWAGPNQWFIELPEADHEDIASFLKSGFKDYASITEQTGGWCRMEVTGEKAVDVLQRLCAVDTAAMMEGDATRSVIEHIGVFIRCTKSREAFVIHGPRSSAGSLHHALIAAAHSVA